MIDSDSRGQEKLEAVLHSRDSYSWSEWERKFLEDQVGREYRGMTPKQQNIVGKLFDKLTWDLG